MIILMDMTSLLNFTVYMSKKVILYWFNYYILIDVCIKLESQVAILVPGMHHLSEGGLA